MLCCIEELREKDVINVCDGENLGYVDDVRVDTQTHTLYEIIFFGNPLFFGWFGARETIAIPFTRVQLVGKDVILICIPRENCTDILKK